METEVDRRTGRQPDKERQGQTDRHIRENKKVVKETYLERRKPLKLSRK